MVALGLEAARCAQGHRHRARRLVERGGPRTCIAGREQSLACGVGTPEPSDSTPGSAAAHLNRRVRNRTHGGVGGRERGTLPPTRSRCAGAGAATPRQIMPATNGCLGRQATGSIRAVRWRQSRQRRRIASSATRMWGWVAWMGQHLGGVHACLTTAGVARRDEHPRAVGVVTQPHPSESPRGREYARRRSWRPRSRQDRRTDRSR